MSQTKVEAEKMYGDLEHDHREEAMFEFKHGEVRVLVGTAKLCGRGVNYNQPNFSNCYLQLIDHVSMLPI